MKSLFPVLLLMLGSPFAGANVSIVTKTLPNGTVGTPYSAVISTSNGCTPTSWSISGVLPAGITKKSSTKPISLSLAGTPTKAGTYSFSVTVTSCGHSSKMPYKVTVQADGNHVVDLSWNASTSTNVSGYNVYRSTDGTTWKKLNSSLVASTVYSDSTVANNSTYYYAATAVDITGKESSKTQSITVVVP
jgi:hypothetical protein